MTKLTMAFFIAFLTMSITSVKAISSRALNAEQNRLNYGMGPRDASSSLAKEAFQTQIYFNPICNPVCSNICE